ncbi:hypothetical protein [Pigmentiphaga humi]|nr:hypothetical protein [Pigmentiphaga humi]
MVSSRKRRLGAGWTGARSVRMLAAWLVLALCVAQWAGVLHEIEHGWSESPAGLAGGPAKAYGHAGHSCVLYAAAALSDGPPALPIVLVPPLASHLPAVLAEAGATPHLAAPRRFLSRAPPQLPA